MSTQTKPIYFEIANPSDPYLIRGENRPAACWATIFLGNGKYALHDEDGEEVLPIFLFAEADVVDEWFREQFGEGLQEFGDKHRAEIADVLDTVIIGSRAARRRLDRCLVDLDDEARERFLEKWHDEHRSSMNDIGGRAKQLAAAFRKSLAKAGG